jgi:hypothetical protein
MNSAHNYLVRNSCLNLQHNGLEFVQSLKFSILQLCQMEESSGFKFGVLGDHSSLRMKSGKFSSHHSWTIFAVYGFVLLEAKTIVSIQVRGCINLLFVVFCVDFELSINKN